MDETCKLIKYFKILVLNQIQSYYRIRRRRSNIICTHNFTYTKTDNKQYIKYFIYDLIHFLNS